MTVNKTCEAWSKKENKEGYGVIVNFDSDNDLFPSKFHKIVFWVGQDNRPLNKISEDVEAAYELAKTEAQADYTRPISILCNMARLLGGRASKWDRYNVIFG